MYLNQHPRILEWHLNILLQKMYLTLSPCPVCAKAIVNAGIDEVVYDEEYEHGSEGLIILKNAGIVVRTVWSK